MGFRRTKSDAHLRQLKWTDWISTHRAELVAIGLPPEVYLDESRWNDFLQNGHLHWHVGTDWNFDELSRNQMRTLCEFLKQHVANDPCRAPLIAWLDVRLKET